MEKVRTKKDHPFPTRGVKMKGKLSALHVYFILEYAKIKQQKNHVQRPIRICAYQRKRQDMNEVRIRS